MKLTWIPYAHQHTCSAQTQAHIAFQSIRIGIKSGCVCAYLTGKHIHIRVLCTVPQTITTSLLPLNLFMRNVRLYENALVFVRHGSTTCNALCYCVSHFVVIIVFVQCWWWRCVCVCVRLAYQSCRTHTHSYAIVCQLSGVRVFEIRTAPNSTQTIGNWKSGLPKRGCMGLLWLYALCSVTVLYHTSNANKPNEIRNAHFHHRIVCVGYCCCFQSKMMVVKRCMRRFMTVDFHPDRFHAANCS